MKLSLLTLPLLAMTGITFAAEPVWITVLLHGAFGLAANASLQTIIQAKKDLIEGTPYERNVLAMREHPFFTMIQPIQKMGLKRVEKKANCCNAAYAFGVLFDEVQRSCPIKEKNIYYTYGWSGLVSQKRRYCEARILYEQLKKELLLYKKKGITPKIRLIGYSHGANVLLNLTDIRRDEFPADTFAIDEVYFIGMPIHSNTCRQIQGPIFKHIYNIYSRSDSVQPLDISPKEHFISHRTFKGCVPEKVTQIELRVLGPLKKIPNQCLPPNMRGIVNQSPGHIEFWFFGWTPSSYRKNILLYPLPACILIPYLVCSAKDFGCSNVQITLRPEEERALIRSIMDDDYCEIPFFSKNKLAAIIEKALTFHPSRPEYKDAYVRLQNSNEIKAYL
jgi:hypothetical protein